MSDDRALKALRNLAQPFADILPLLSEIEKAGSLQAYVSRLNGNVEALRREEEAAKQRITDGATEANLVLKAARDEVASIHADAASAKAGADKYVSDQTNAGNAALAQARTQANSIVENARKEAERVIASYDTKTEEAKSATQSAKAALDIVNAEITERQSVLTQINDQLEALRKGAR